MTTQDSPDIVSITAGDTRPAIRIESLLEEGGSSRTLRRTLYGIIALITALLAWAIIADVDELARARGEIQPGGHVQALQSQDGGTIVNLLVEEGDQVIPGQPIAEFIATDVEKIITQTRVKLNSLAIDREQMAALLENREPDFSAYANEYKDLVRQAQRTFEERTTGRDAAIAAKRNEVAQQISLLEGAAKERELITREIAESRNRLERLEDGAKRGVIPQLRLSEARQQMLNMEERGEDISARVASIKNTIGSLNQELAGLQANFNQDLSTELSRITEEYSELQAELKALEERQGRIDLRSPVTGIVMNLPETLEGAVIPPGGTVAQIVPTGTDVFMEVMVTPRDIGFVKEGQRASVKIDSFDAARFGAVQGHVVRVAPTSSKMPQTGAPFYRVQVALDTPYVGSVERRLVPGMTGEADIATGRKSVLQYLLKPIFLASDTAFHER